MKLHQTIALAKTRKQAAKTTGDQLYHLLSRHQLAAGLTESYAPATEDDVPVEANSKKVQVRAEPMFRAYLESQAPAWDTDATLDKGNTTASADVTVDGRVLLENVPVTTLIALEKRIIDVRTTLAHCPVLDDAELWRDEPNATTGLYETEPRLTVRTKKVDKHEVVVQATDRFPAQVVMSSVDVKAGTWTRVKVSGAMTQTRHQELTRRVAQLLEAVKTAREEANSADVQDAPVAAPLISWLMTGE